MPIDEIFLRPVEGLRLSPAGCVFKGAALRQEFVLHLAISHHKSVHSSGGFAMKRLSSLMTIAIGCLTLTIGGCATTSTVKPASQPCEVDAYASTHPRPIPSGVPSDWDKSIPAPPRGTVVAVSDLPGVMRHVDFHTEGETYSSLKTFYTTELGAAGYNVGKPVEQPGQKSIDITFSACGKLDTVSIFPDQENPKDFNVRVVYDTGGTTNKAGTTNPVQSLYVDCSFGDADACNQLDSRPGGADAYAEHDGMIREQLKSPEQRATDRDRALHGL
jgi:hypothetical protein